MPKFDLSAQFPILKKKKTVLLHPREGFVDPRHSKIGGCIAWPSSEEWPFCSEHKLPFVAVIQLLINDVPELGFPEGKDLFQLLWCPDCHEEPEGPLAQLFWRKSSDVGALLKCPPAPKKDVMLVIPRECEPHFERIEELPSSFEIDGETDTKVGQWLMENAAEEMHQLGLGPDGGDAYQYSFSVAPSTKVGGWVSWIQEPKIPACKCGRKMEHLLTISSSEYGGAGGERWCPIDETQEEREKGGHRLTIGDAGSYYVFVCRHCKGLPFKAFAQFS